MKSEHPQELAGKARSLRKQGKTLAEVGRILGVSRFKARRLIGGDPDDRKLPPTLRGGRVPKAHLERRLDLIERLSRTCMTYEQIAFESGLTVDQVSTCRRMLIERKRVKPKSLGTRSGRTMVETATLARALLARGLTSKEAGQQLGLSPSTITAYARRIGDASYDPKDAPPRSRLRPQPGWRGRCTLCRRCLYPKDDPSFFHRRKGELIPTDAEGRSFRGVLICPDCVAVVAADRDTQGEFHGQTQTCPETAIPA
jgi:DNA-binding CsgD family transcriptional regulator